jgi:hypothetical protein
LLAAGPLVPGGVVKEPTGREGGGRREEGEGNERKEHKGDGGYLWKRAESRKARGGHRARVFMPISYISILFCLHTK